MGKLAASAATAFLASPLLSSLPSVGPDRRSKPLPHV
jgi:hypothetical protein